MDPIADLEARLMERVTELTRQVHRMQMAESGLAWVMIADILLSQDQADITFSQIPQKFRHLRTVGSLRSNRANVGESVGIQLNGDTGNNYYSHRFVHTVTGGFVTSEQMAAGFISLGGVVGDTAVASSFGMVDYMLVDYTSLTILKSMLCSAHRLGATSSGGTSLEVAGGTWAKTPIQAVTSIKYYPVAGGTVWKAGSRLTLIGIA